MVFPDVDGVLVLPDGDRVPVFLAPDQGVPPTHKTGIDIARTVYLSI